MDEILKFSATELAEQLKSQQITPEQLVAASLDAISQTNDQYQAFISVDEHGATKAAQEIGQKIRNGEEVGPLAGLPIAIKDVVDVKGMATTQGSLLTSRTPATEDDELIARIRRAGGIFIGKTNTPEFGFGAVCTNKICGPTCNPWNPELTSGGSSGGSAVAVAAGWVPLAHGADFGGSVRTPASFTGSIGLRPTPGRIPEPKRPFAWDTLATQGVMTRTVDDAQLLYQVMQGPNYLDPASQVMTQARASSHPPKVAATTNFDGAFPVDPEVRSRFERAIGQASAVVGQVESAHPSVEGAADAFRTLRAAHSWLSHGKRVTEQPDKLTESFVWNVKQGQSITAEKYLQAQVMRAKTYRAFQKFFDQYDILMLPAASVMPFPNAQGEVEEIDGQHCETIIDYLACTFLISLVGCPTMSIPAPVEEGELPFGVQLVARPFNENVLLQVARQLEQEGGFKHIWPTRLTTRPLSK